MVIFKVPQLLFIARPSCRRSQGPLPSSFLQNTKLCLLFCASAGDLKLCDIDDDGSPAATPHSGGKRAFLQPPCNFTG